MTTLPAHIRRCPGDGSFEDGEWHWREGCDDCLRRTAPGGRRGMEPPPIIVFVAAATTEWFNNHAKATAE